MVVHRRPLLIPLPTGKAHWKMRDHDPDDHLAAIRRITNGNFRLID
ncbi:hypothetical protein [Actinomadura rudentiformis]|nr:hypothetical protein [Actinomadura rudentiformis]